jgi:hypothetical protein
MKTIQKFIWWNYSFPNSKQEYDIDGSKFTSGNLYVKQQNVSAYQSEMGSGSPANQNMFCFPLNCATPNIVDNTVIQTVGSTSLVV